MEGARTRYREWLKLVCEPERGKEYGNGIDMRTERIRFTHVVVLSVN